MSLSNESVVEARVETVRGYGVLLRCGEDRILVLITDVCRGRNRGDGRKTLALMKEGDRHRVKILGWDDRNKHYVGSISGVTDTD